MSTKLVTYVLIRDKAAGRVLLVDYTGDGSPNPKRSGHWVPAPELTHGERPEDCARRVLATLGIAPEAAGTSIKLAGVDSFVTRDWHVLFNYVVDVPAGTAVRMGGQYASAAWFDLKELPDGTAFAHGNWERELVGKLDAAV